jgi:uncharacterized protein (TIGR04222 family)
MGQPWGLSGPQFLGVYAAGIGLTILIPFIIRQVIRGLPGRRARRELDPYEVGYLVGGPRRAAEVVIAEGVDCGALRVDSSGRVTRAYQAAATGPHAGALDRVTLDGLSTHALATKLRSDPSIARIGPDLSADGLVISRGPMKVLRLVSAVLIVALLVTGILRLMEGSHNHRPIGDLTGLFVLSLITSFFVLMSTVGRSTKTRKGASYLRRLRKAHSAGAALPSSLAFSGAPVSALDAAAIGGGAVLLGIALAGFSAVPDETMRQALLAGMPTPSTSGGSSCSGGGGCGGGGCGGGGCGG